MVRYSGHGLNSELKACYSRHVIHIFVFLTPNMDSLTPKTCKMSPNNISIRPNLTNSVSRGLEDGFGGGEGAAPLGNISINVCTFFCTFLKNLKLCFTGFETGCKPVLLIIEQLNSHCIKQVQNIFNFYTGNPKIDLVTFKLNLVC